LHVDQDADRWVDGRDLFDGENGLEKGSRGATVFDGDFDAHQAEVEELRNQLGMEVLLLVHGADQRRDIILRKLADGRAKQLFIFRKQGEGRSGLRCKNRICHGNKATVEMPACPASPVSWTYMGKWGSGTERRRGTLLARREWKSGRTDPRCTMDSFSRSRILRACRRAWLDQGPMGSSLM
jgi:hypothetical protein